MQKRKAIQKGKGGNPQTLTEEELDKIMDDSAEPMDEPGYGFMKPPEGYKLFQPDLTVDGKPATKRQLIAMGFRL